jgi:DNA end-binding protein Ku
VIREAMKKKGMVALGPAGDEHRERICAIEIEESGLLMTTLPCRTRRCWPSRKRLSTSRPANSNPAEFVDRYEDALRELIERRRPHEIRGADVPVKRH